jgi:hypothetical protein
MANSATPYGVLRKISGGSGAMSVSPFTLPELRITMYNKARSRILHPSLRQFTMLTLLTAMFVPLVASPAVAADAGGRPGIAGVATATTGADVELDRWPGSHCASGVYSALHRDYGGLLACPPSLPWGRGWYLGWLRDRCWCSWGPCWELWRLFWWGATWPVTG